MSPVLASNHMVSMIILSLTLLSKTDSRGRTVAVGRAVARQSHSRGLDCPDGLIHACASAWIDGQLVHIEDLVLHDASMDIRSPTRELTRAHAVLRGASTHRPGTSAIGPVALGLECIDRGEQPSASKRGKAHRAPRRKRSMRSMRMGSRHTKPRRMVRSRATLPGLEAISQRTNRLLSELAARPPESRDPMVYDLDWDENARMASWREAVGSTENMPSLLAGAIALLAWEEIEPLQHRAWLGRSWSPQSSGVALEPCRIFFA